MNRFDIENLNNSLSGLSQTILQNRMMGEQKAERGQARQDRLSEQAKMDEYRQELLKEKIRTDTATRDPNNPLNKERSAQADLALKKMQQLGVEKVKSSWTTEDGRKIEVEGTPEVVKQAAQNDPPIKTEKVTTEFVTRDGVKHTMVGTPDQLQAQQDSMSKAGGGIEPYGQSKSPATTVDWPIGPASDTGAQQGRIKGLVTDPSVRAMMGTNAPPMPAAPLLPGQPPPTAATNRFKILQIQ